VALAHSPQTAGCASNVSVRHHDLRRAPGDYLIFDSNAVHGGLNQRFLNLSWLARAGSRQYDAVIKEIQCPVEGESPKNRQALNKNAQKNTKKHKSNSFLKFISRENPICQLRSLSPD